MTKPTQTECLIAALKDAGQHEVESKSRKYRTFVKSDDPTKPRVFIGKAGAMRVGANVSSSVSVLAQTRQRFIERGLRVLTEGKSA